eukprot:1185658-Prorocentrum_minimum.AAC.1
MANNICGGLVERRGVASAAGPGRAHRLLLGPHVAGGLPAAPPPGPALRLPGLQPAPAHPAGGEGAHPGPGEPGLHQPRVRPAVRRVPGGGAPGAERAGGERQGGGGGCAAAQPGGQPGGHGQGNETDELNR